MQRQFSGSGEGGRIGRVLKMSPVMEEGAEVGGHGKHAQQYRHEEKSDR